MDVSRLFSLAGKTAAVTGGTGVLGQEFCRALAGAGARIALIGRNPDKTAAFAAQLRAEGGEAMACTADVLDPAALAQARGQVLDAWGRIDLLISAAGGNLPEAVVPPGGSFLDLEPEALRGVMDLNFMGTVLPARIFGEAMAAQGQGAMVQISSMAAQRPLTRVAGYSAAKAALDNFTRWLAVDLARKFGEGLRVNAIAPGFFLTEQNRSLLTLPGGGLTPRGEAILAHTPAGRFGQPGDLAGTLIWLCSDASRFVTGTVIPVDGGFSAYAGV
ncbi:MAG: SDR family oxidoreductase [Bacteroidia bacterium]|nr:SDR family oxidoreductase [Bacteroidia bacterium]